eukprot:TRINITY_DN1705_c0_g2_i2.p2 TRINITY_DN1705_c0_g2~~TRINITY_DN1705_c0_g2_i2.p2  ORF type:complete len:192 (-),score=18.13 TRINITY_DN1705_c0_g2_i2:52-627(-)
MEATLICIDNSEWTRSGDFSPTRYRAQLDAVNLLAMSKTEMNPENAVGIMTMAGKTPKVLVTLTNDLGGLLTSLRSRSPFKRAVPMFVLLLGRLMVFGLRVSFGSTYSLPIVWYLIAESSALVGGIINVVKIPEKWVCFGGVRQQGLFDYWFNSHQLMHILVIISISCFVCGACNDYQLNVVQKPPCKQSV